MKNFRFGQLTFLFLMALTLNSHAGLIDCWLALVNRGNGVPFTRGHEFEWTRPVLSPTGVFEGVQDEQMNRALVREIGRSQFRNLFAFYGLSPSGEWVENGIPGQYMTGESVSEARRNGADLNLNSSGMWIIENWNTISERTFYLVIQAILTSRGPQSSDRAQLRLQKIPRAWRSKRNRFDRLIPDVVSEEWRGNRFGGLEFAMSEGVRKEGDIQRYVLNLWRRLGIFEIYPEIDPNLAFEVRARGHVHGVANVLGLPLELRKDTYEGLIGHWGDMNDFYFLELTGTLGSTDADLVISDGSVWDRLGPYHLGQTLSDYSIRVLTRDLYERVEVSESGVRIQDRDSDIYWNLEQDPNFPTTYKLLSLGLRGIYGQGVLPASSFVPIVGLEGRSGDDIAKNLALLPPTVPGRPREFDLRELHARQHANPRGVVGDPASLSRILAENGFDEGFLSEVEGDIDIMDVLDHLRWTREQLRAMFLSPLTNWLDHPLVLRNLEALSPEEREAFRDNYTAAFSRYRDRIHTILEHRRRNQPLQLVEGTAGVPLQSNDYVAGDRRLNYLTYFLMLLHLEAQRFLSEARVFYLVDPEHEWDPFHIRYSPQGSR